MQEVREPPPMKDQQGKYSNEKGKQVRGYKGIKLVPLETTTAE